MLAVGMAEKLKQRNEIQTERAAERPSFSLVEQLGKVGVFICKKTAQRRQILISERNLHFFVPGNHADAPEVSYQGSGWIASELVSEYDMEMGRPLIEGAVRGRRPLAFFDVEGNFYDKALLFDVVELMDRNGHEAQKHQAHFQWLDENNQLKTKAFAVDDIYCISAAAVDGSPPPIKYSRAL